ncbi:hypothetical protein [Thalassotalea agarivorans]|uniref:Uncharacterized protein n=1 Tax=Thalassotalea agarivorans TaxID=349064 RepID=A0A1I0GYX4_THASX|nr:hypothetical protein [Thalassotalea agarivorans]SET75559.1 hypothetical protein SAMN05660429_02604 [Thalassotalea agarivorans]
MKNLSFLLFLIIFSSTSVACRYKEKSIESHYSSSEFVYEGVITGVFYPDFEKAIRSLERPIKEGSDLPLIVGERMIFDITPLNILKGKDVPRKVIFSGCGSGSATIKSRVLIFVSEYKSQWYGYFLQDGEHSFKEALAKVANLAQKQANN